jgi:hypothetical protein
MLLPRISNSIRQCRHPGVALDALLEIGPRLPRIKEVKYSDTTGELARKRVPQPSREPGLTVTRGSAVLAVEPYPARTPELEIPILDK